MERIDTHQHLWDLTRFTLPWLPQSGVLSESHPPSRYEAESIRLEIVQTIYMEVDVAPEQRSSEASYVFALCDDPGNPMAGAVIGGDPASPDFMAYLDATNHPARKGVRQVLHGGQPRGYCLSEPFQRGLKALGERGLLFDFCVRPEELCDAAACAQLLPENKFILDHCGNAPIHGDAVEIALWEAGMQLAAEQSNVCVKLSGIVAQAREDRPIAEQIAPFIEFTLDVFGPERALWASDWPVCKSGASLVDWVEALDTILSPRTDAERAMIFCENARRVYGLS